MSASPQTIETESTPFIKDDSTALYMLQAWMLKLRQHGLISVSGENILSLANRAAHRFFLGIRNQQPFLGVQDFEMTWFSRIPWAHAAMYRDNPHIYFVSDTLNIHGDDVQPFALDINVDSDAVLKALQTADAVGMREVQASNGRASAVAASNFSELPILMLEYGQNVMSADIKPKHRIKTR